MTILFEPAPTGTTHFIRYASGHVVWCKAERGENNQLVLKEWDSFNKCWLPGIHTVEHYQSAGLTSIDDFPTEPASPVPESAPAGTTHCYHHAGEISWYRETADGLFVLRDGSWYASFYKKALDLANGCALGAVTSLGEEKQPEQDAPTGTDDDWYERGELPPIGTVCQAKLWDRDWDTMTIKGYHENTVWAGTNLCSLDKAEFRPIPSERDKAIEAMKALCQYPGSWETCYKSFAEALYDAGYRAGGAA